MPSVLTRKLNKAAEEYTNLTNVASVEDLHNCPLGSDVTLYIGTTKRRLYAHEKILSFSSPYFERMLDRSSPFQEAHTRIVLKPNWEWSVAFSLTKYMYTGKLRDVPASMLTALYDAADEAQVEPLLYEMSKREKDYHQLFFDRETVGAVLEFAKRAKLDALANMAALYIRITNSPAPIRLNEDTVKQYPNRKPPTHHRTNLPSPNWTDVTDTTLSTHAVNNAALMLIVEDIPTDSPILDHYKTGAFQLSSGSFVMITKLTEFQNTLSFDADSHGCVTQRDMQGKSTNLLHVLLTLSILK